MQDAPTVAQDQAAELAQACNALWAATLSLMVAFMHQSAPAHRYLLAKRIARNFETLKEQECFSAATRDKFVTLAKRWQQKVKALSPVEAEKPGVLSRLQRLLAG
jgi:hypothetical protein